jgi:hypothetical protein
VISVIVKMPSLMPIGNLCWNSSGVSSVSSRWNWIVSSKRPLSIPYNSEGQDFGELPVVVFNLTFYSFAGKHLHLLLSCVSIGYEFACSYSSRPFNTDLHSNPLFPLLALFLGHPLFLLCEDGHRFFLRLVLGG